MSVRVIRTQFDPRRLADCNLWLDFSDSQTHTLDGSSLISSISDKSGRGLSFGQTTAANRPSVSSLNGRPCGSWPTSANNVSLTFTTAAQNWQEVCVVAQWDGGGTTFPDYHGLFGPAPNAGNLGLVGQAAAGVWYPVARFFSGAVILNGTATETAFPTITSPFVVQFSNATSVSVSGGQVGGDRSIAARGWRGRICEVVSYGRQLSADERTWLRRSIAAKWGFAS